MSSGATAPLRLVTFGDLEGSVWGAAMDAGEPAIVFGAASASEAVAGATSVNFVAAGDNWQLTGPGFDLVITPPAPAPETTPPAPAPDTDADPDADPEDGTPEVSTSRAGAGADQLCAITGTITIGGSELTVDCVGTRSTDSGFDTAGVESLRAVAGWFGRDRGLALRAVRPQRARGQEGDRIEATLFEPEGEIAVEDPRLSTTIAAGGRPSRTSLELWINVGEEQYPRRAAGEALGEGGAAQGEAVSLQVTPLRCHTGGHEGAGVYLLARF